MLVVKRKPKTSKGGGIINSLINHLPFAIKAYGEYCGPGTDLKYNKEHNVQAIDKLDQSCKDHDYAYSNSKDLASRHKADKELIERAWERFKSKDASFSERAAAYLITNIMKTKVKLGAGVKGKRCKKGKGVKKLTKLKMERRKKKETRKIKSVRVIPLPKRGGILKYLIPLLTGLSNVGSFAETANELLKKVQSLRGGKGLKKKAVLAPFKRGYGLYLRPYEPKFKDPNY